MGVILLIIIPVIVFVIQRYITPPQSSLPALKQASKLPQPQPGSCLVLEEKYCRNAEIVEWQNPKAQKMKLIAFRLPSGVPIFAPLSGSIFKTNEGNSPIDPKAAVLGIYNPENPNAATFGTTGGLTFPEDKFTAQKGDTIAYTAKGVTVLEKYDLVFYFLKFDPEKKIWVTDEKIEQELFHP